MRQTALTLAFVFTFMLAQACCAQFSGGGGKTAPGGTNGQIQYNNSGAFGGNSLSGLGIAASGTNADITSLTALTGAQTGGFFGGVTTVSAATAVLTGSSGSFVNVTYTGGSGSVITLPDATTCQGKPFYILNGTTNKTTTINSVSSQLLYNTAGRGNGSGTSLTLTNGGAVAIISDGSNWQSLFSFVVSSYNGTNGAIFANQGSGAYGFTFPAINGSQPYLGNNTWGNTVEATTTTTASTLALTATSNRNQKLDCTSNAITVTLSDATACANKQINFTKIDSTANAVTFNTTSSQTISGIASGSLTITKQWQELHLYSDGANWILKTNSIPTTVAATSGANANITSLTGLTTPLSAAQGGTGTALFGSGTATFSSAGSVAVADASVTSSSIFAISQVGTTPLAENFSYAVTAGTGVTFYSSNVASTATLSYIRIK